VHRAQGPAPGRYGAQHPGASRRGCRGSLGSRLAPAREGEEAREKTSSDPPFTAEAEGGGSVRDEREAELVLERGGAFRLEGLESRGAPLKELAKKIRLPWTVLRQDGRQDGGLGGGIYVESALKRTYGSGVALWTPVRGEEGAPRLVLQAPADDRAVREADGS
jgi:hypothetical protein